MEIKKLLLVLYIVLVCCVGTVCATDLNDTVDMVSIDSNDESILVNEDEQSDDMVESVLSAQKDNGNFNVTAADEILSVSDEDILGITNQATNQYLNDIKTSTSDEYFKFIDYLIKQKGFKFNTKNSDDGYTIYSNSKYFCKLYDGENYVLPAKNSYFLSKNRIGYVVMGEYSYNQNYNESNIVDSPNKSFTDLNNLFNDLNKSEIILEDDYVNQKGEDTYYHFFEGDILLTDGIFINRSMTIDGQGHVIDANNLSEIFFINVSNVKLKNIIFKNGKGSSPIICYAPDIIFINCTFLNNHGDIIGAGAISCYANAEIINSTFIDNYRVENDDNLDVAIYYQDVVFNIVNESISYSINNKKIYDVVKFNRNCNVTIINSIFRNSPTHEIHYDRPLVIINGGDNSTNNTNPTNNLDVNKTTWNNVESTTENNTKSANNTDINKTNDNSKHVIPVHVNDDVDTNMSQITPTIDIIANNTYVINSADDIIEFGFKTNIKNKMFWVEVPGLLSKSNLTSDNNFSATITLKDIAKSGNYTILCGFYDYNAPVVVGSDDIPGVACKKIIEIICLDDVNKSDSIVNNTGNNADVIKPIAPTNTLSNKTDIINPVNTDNETGIVNNTDIVKPSVSVDASVKSFSIIVAKNKVFNKKLKTKLYSIVLKGKNGKVLKNIWITLKINGKSFKAKTNNKGKATFKIKINKKGKSKAKITFKGDNNYNKCTKKVKIIVK